MSRVGLTLGLIASWALLGCEGTVGFSQAPDDVALAPGESHVLDFVLLAEGRSAGTYDFGVDVQPPLRATLDPTTARVDGETTVLVTVALDSAYSGAANSFIGLVTLRAWERSELSARQSVQVYSK